MSGILEKRKSEFAHVASQQSGMKKEMGWEELKRLIIREVKNGNKTLEDWINYYNEEDHKKPVSRKFSLEKKLKTTLKGIKCRCNNKSNQRY